MVADQVPIIPAQTINLLQDVILNLVLNNDGNKNTSASTSPSDLAAASTLTTHDASNNGS